MTEYAKKKKLMEENSDMYFSDYDKTLSYEALSRVTDAKRDFINAAKSNDKKGMTKANDVANAVRAKYGSYTGGDDGSEYHPFSYDDDDFYDYESLYEDELDKLYNRVKKASDKFTYDYTKDPAYLAYKKVYETQGNLGYDRALAQNALKTGGIANSYAQSAASQALNYYNSQLAAKIPELYNAAYDRYMEKYTSDYNRLKDAYDMVKNRENRDYLRYLNDIEGMREDRDYNYKQHKDIRDMLANEEKTALNYERNNDKSDFLYDLLRDSVEDEKWRWEYNLDAQKQGSPAYNGSVGNSDILEYARRIFGNENLTKEDLYRILGL